MDFTIGPRVAETRKRAGLTVEALAALASVPAEALAALETGGSPRMSTAAVARLAQALDVDLADWVGGATPSPQPSMFFRQAGVPDFFDSDRGAVVEALKEARATAVVDAILGRTYKRGDLQPLATGGVPWKQGYELAQRVRRALGAPVEPLGDMRELVEDQFGVPVLATDFHAANLLAVTAKERDLDHVAIILNGKRGGDHRVDLAHELAHSLFDAPSREIDYWIDLTDEPLDITKLDKAEQRAKAFAAELLIPQQGLAATFGHAHEHLQGKSSLSAAIDLAERVGDHFRATPELTVNHLVNNGYISKDLREEVAKTAKVQAATVLRRAPMLHRRLSEALGAGLITQMRARELLGLSARDPLPSTVKLVP